MEIQSLLSIAIICSFPLVNSYPRLVQRPLMTSMTPPITSGEKKSEIGRGVTVQHISNYNISFVPLVKVILNMIPKIVNRIIQPQQNNTGQRAREISITPAEFFGTNPCIDSILSRKQYPGSSCHFYECILHQPAPIKCLLEVIEDSAIGDSSLNSHKKLNAASSYLTTVKISECLSIRIHKCLPGHIYDSHIRSCIQNKNNYGKINVCST